MQNIVKETVTQQTPGGASTISATSAQDTQTQTIVNVIYFISGVIEVTLLFRFLLKVSGANPGSIFVSLIYGFTQFLTLPFTSIFSAATSTGVEVRSVFEPATLIAMLVYAVVAWGIVKLVAILAGQSNEEL